jgi:hypothetical protein
MLSAITTWDGFKTFVYWSKKDLKKLKDNGLRGAKIGNELKKN